MKLSNATVAGIIIGCLGLVPRPANCEIVYDSPLESQYGSLLAIEVGTSMSLAGSARMVSQIDLGMGSSNDSEVFWVRFYSIDNNNFPDTLLWESPLQVWTDDSPSAVTKMVSVEVPNIVVPGRFAWTTRRILPSQLTQASSDYPTIGTFLTSFSLNPLVGDEWIPNDAPFSSRIYAIPEPCTLLLLALAGFSVLCVRRR